MQVHTLEELCCVCMQNIITTGLMYAMKHKNGNISYREICDVVGSYAA